MVGKPIMDKDMLNNRKMCAMRGRMHNEAWKQQFEIREDGISNTITSISKDWYTIGRWVKDMGNNEMVVDEVMENKPKVEDYLWKDYGVFKLSPLECLRLQGVKDEDSKKMLAVNSKSQCYKQAGNSITVPVLMALFSQLGIVGVKKWNDMSEDERQAMSDKVRDWDDRCVTSD